MRHFGFWAALTFLISSCSSSDNSRDKASGGDGTGSTTTLGAGGSGIINPTGTGGGIISVDGGGNGGVTRPLDGTIVSPSGNQITVSGKPVAVQFDVKLKDGTTAPKVDWTVDDTRVGSIGTDGVFHGNGYVGGIVTITATANGGTASIQITVDVDITDPGSLPPADQPALVAGGGSDPAFKWLYPYDQTIFPRGLQAPVLQFGGTTADATYVKVSAPHFSYRQFATGGPPVRVTLPEPVWKGVNLTVGAMDTISVEATKRSGATVAGPIKESWSIAQATLKGIIYYATYKSPLTAMGALNGGILRLRPGQTAEVVQNGCTVCHSVSANGNVLATGLNYSVSGTTDEALNPVDSATYDLSPAGTAALRMKSPEGRQFSFSALSPDGKVALTNGLPVDRWPPFIVFGERAPMGYASKLVDTTSGLEIVAPTLAQMVTYAQTPSFSPDGKHVAFANGDRLERRVLTVADFDGVASPPAFSNPRDLVNQVTPAMAWPSFLPDSKAILYHEGDSFDSRIFTDGDGASKPQYADIHMVEIADGTVKPLDTLNGRGPGGTLYIPSYGEVNEGHMNYEPNVLPLPVGGYYWVIFTSRRTYGNTIAPGGSLARGEDIWGHDSAPSPRKKLWLAAIDVDHSGKADPSHPPLYIPGQELESGNMRGFGALAPCQPEGATCESGADCCGGFCRETGRSADGVPMLKCVPPPMKCSFVDEKCTTAADCCNPSNLCINNRCADQGVPR